MNRRKPPGGWWIGTPPVRFFAWNIFLIAMPLVAFVIGGATVLRHWRNDPDLRQAAREAILVLRAHTASVLIAAATLLAGGILAIVALHLITD